MFINKFWIQLIFSKFFRMVENRAVMSENSATIDFVLSQAEFLNQLAVRAKAQTAAWFRNILCNNYLCVKPFAHCVLHSNFSQGFFHVEGVQSMIIPVSLACYLISVSVKLFCHARNRSFFS